MTIRSVALASVVVGSMALAGCESAPEPSVAPTESAPRPAVQIDETWTATNGEWTFTGFVDPAGDPTDVMLEVGPGPSTARRFDQQIPVAQDLTEAGPLTTTTRDIPDIDEICVRFTATNGAGTSLTSPLCFPHDLPSFVIDAEPPAVTFTAPPTGTTTDIDATTYTVTWTETEEGSGISRRSLQRLVAEDSGGGCGAFEDDGPARTEPSPVAVSGLIAGKCYQWVETLIDHAGNASSTTSGTVRVAAGSP
jgi:hypothetical protein